MHTRISLGLLLTAIAAMPASAHHTVAYDVDISKLVALTGTVTSVEWKNPHVIFHLAVPDVTGTRVDWEIESRHIDGMRRDGIASDTIKVGDALTMNVMVTRNGSHHAATASVVLPDGRKVIVCTVTNNACPS